MKIDYLIPYVDPTKKDWLELYSKYSKYDITGKLEYSKRFCDNILLKYQFRGVEKYMPWINIIHLIVQSEDQVPEWINRDNVNIVYHKDFIPEKYLPTFNSCTIECFLHMIPNLEEHFIYSNDDLYVFNNCTELDFFSQDGYQRNNIRALHCKTNSMWLRLMRNTNEIISSSLKLKFRMFEPYHIQQGFTKTMYRNTYNRFKNKIEDSITYFRNEKNISQCLFSMYFTQLTKWKYINNELKYNFFNLHLFSQFEKLRSYLKNDYNFKLLCLNNSNLKIDKEIDLKFGKMLPKISKYEKI